MTDSTIATQAETQSHKPLRDADKIAAGVLAAFFTIFLVNGWGLEFGTPASPGPGFWPKIVLGLGLVTSVLIFLFGKDKIIPTEMDSPKKLLLYIAALILMPVLYPYIGFLLPAFLSLSLLFFFDAKLNWAKTITLAAIAVAVIYAIFGIALGMPIRPY